MRLTVNDILRRAPRPGCPWARPTPRSRARPSTRARSSREPVRGRSAARGRRRPARPRRAARRRRRRRGGRVGMALDRGRVPGHAPPGARRPGPAGGAPGRRAAGPGAQRRARRGVTGATGKTTTKDILVAMLRAAGVAAEGTPGQPQHRDRRADVADGPARGHGGRGRRDGHARRRPDRRARGAGPARRGLHHRRSARCTWSCSGRSRRWRRPRPRSWAPCGRGAPPWCRTESRSSSPISQPSTPA